MGAPYAGPYPMPELVATRRYGCLSWIRTLCTGGELRSTMQSVKKVIPVKARDPDRHRHYGEGSRGRNRHSPGEERVSMAEWPVRTEDFEPRPSECEPIPAGTELVVMCSRGQGGEVLGYHFQCPCCGWLYYVPIEGTTVDQEPSGRPPRRRGPQARGRPEGPRRFPWSRSASTPPRSRAASPRSSACPPGRRGG